jgi:hypothetical protein
MMDVHWRRQAKLRSAHTWELRRPDSGGVYVLDWYHDADQRDLTGWYLRGPAGPGGPRSRRLAVDPAIEIVAADRATPAQEWTEWAETVAALTEAIAITRAQDAMLDGAPEPPARALAGSAPRHYELVVTGVDAARLARAFPALACTESDRTVVLSGVLDDSALRGISRRLATLGCRLAGVRTPPR